MLRFVLNLILNQMICCKHIIHSLFKWRVFRRFWIYLFLSFMIVLIQIILCITFYSSNNSSIESKIQNQINFNEKYRKTNVSLNANRVNINFDFDLIYSQKWSNQLIMTLKLIFFQLIQILNKTID